MPESATAMAQRAVEIFNDTFAAGQKGISAEARALYVPEPVIVPFRAALEGNEYSGPNALDDFVAETRESWDWVRIEPEEIRELDAQRALVVGELFACGRETGAETHASIAVLLVVGEGRVAEARTYTSERDALAEARP